MNGNSAYFAKTQLVLTLVSESAIPYSRLLGYEKVKERQKTHTQTRAHTYR